MSYLTAHWQSISCSNQLIKLIFCARALQPSRNRSQFRKGAQEAEGEEDSLIRPRRRPRLPRPSRMTRRSSARPPWSSHRRTATTTIGTPSRRVTWPRWVSSLTRRAAPNRTPCRPITGDDEASRGMRRPRRRPSTSPCRTPRGTCRLDSD